MAKFSSVVMGNESLLIECSKKLLAQGHVIMAVVTRCPDITNWAQAQSIPVLAPGADLGDRLEGGFDWFFSIANLAIIPDAVLARPLKGAINFHDGPLPKHAGLNAPVWALIEGETEHGVSWHMIEGGVDEGRIVAQQRFAIDAGDTALTLNTKAYEAGLNSFGDVIDALENPAFAPVAQDLSQRSYHARADRPSAGGCLDLTRPAEQMDRMIRALDHATYWNPLCTPKLWLGDRVWSIGAARIVDTQAKPGTVTEAGKDRLVVMCGTGALALSGLTTLDGHPVNPSTHLSRGEILPLQTAQVTAAMDVATEATAPHDAWWRKRLATLNPIAIGTDKQDQGDFQTIPLSARTDPARIAVWAMRLAQMDSCDLAFTDERLADLAGTGLVEHWVPLPVSNGGTLADLASRLTSDLATLENRVGFARDLALRDRSLTLSVPPRIGLSQAAGTIPGTTLTVELTDTGALLHFDATRVPEMLASLMAARLDLLAETDMTQPLTEVPSLPEVERQMVLNDWNTTEVEAGGPQTIPAQFEAQVARTPNAPALVFETLTLSYAELNARANRVAHTLRTLGVGTDEVVGLHCARSADLLIGALGILKAGGAYLPLDPAYPADRLEHYVADSGAKIIVSQSAIARNLPAHSAQVLEIDSDPRIAQGSEQNPDGGATADSLAYLIYTSGSTGTPKGVMVEHGNVANFFAGMDPVVPHDTPGTWLAVTSLSFDISVLELFWTTARGFKVVITSDEDRGMISNGHVPVSDSHMDFSLYYWGNDDGVGRDKYRTLLEGAKFADQHGFSAVWTPERHFHAFGGPYPNPSVTGAAVAAVTRNIGVRSGSVVAPLHHPARIAEEWAVIDNLTNGRAGLAMASGWQPDDFVLRPENTPPNNRAALTESINKVRDLWAGKPVAFPRADGTLHEVITQPRPVSTHLPIWMTIAGNPDTWRQAGKMGCNVLTHLLGQSIEDVAGMIKVYHDELRNAGHDPKDFSVSLMLHTCLANTRDEARERAREPMKDYLRSAAGLIKQYAWAFPAFKRPKGVNNAFDLQLDVLEDGEMDEILNFAFERYFNDSGLFGTVDDALARTEQLKAIGVTEIACLIDYGINADEVLDGLPLLAQVVQHANAGAGLPDDDFSIAAQIERHNVTHMQCTPSMARMIAMNEEARAALRKVSNIFLGGEALPGGLVSELATLSDATLTNMYGPTETTIWSSTEVADASEVTVNVGLPIANTQMYVLDDRMQPCPVGVAGELWIGGKGVTRGYWNQPELTAERFVQNPFHGGRMYRTGDLVARRVDGKLDFIGRADNQVKLRGYRIELGEIEAALESQHGIQQAVVIVREDIPGDKRLVAYVTAQMDIDEKAMRAALSHRLPFHMIPQRFVRLDAFPLTPNRKIDRKALPAPQAVTLAAKPAEVARNVVAPAPGVTTGQSDSQVMATVAEVWAGMLGEKPASAVDNFFDLGGHSLLAVQAHRQLRDRFGAQALTITDIFRFPTLESIAGRITALTGGTPVADPAAKPQQPAQPAQNTRALSRAEAMNRRKTMRAKRSA